MKSTHQFVVLVGFIAQTFGPITHAASSGCPTRMPRAVEAKLLPILDALSVALRKDDIWDKALERRFAAFLSAKDGAARDARIALMDYYVGEAYSEDLACAAFLDGKRSIVLLKRCEACDLAPSRSPIPRDHGLPLRRITLKMLERGEAEQCVP